MAVQCMYVMESIMMVVHVIFVILLSSLFHHAIQKPILDAQSLMNDRNKMSSSLSETMFSCVCRHPELEKGEPTAQRSYFKVEVN